MHGREEGLFSFVIVCITPNGSVVQEVTSVFGCLCLCQNAQEILCCDWGQPAVQFSVVTESDIALGDRKGLKVLMLCQPFQLWGCSLDR
jgi:hypothetical protein